MTEKNAERKMEGEEIIPGGAGIHATIPETPAGRGAAMKLFEVLCPEAREELTRHRIVWDPDGTFRQPALTWRQFSSW
jgi:hypothetical protein